MRQFTLFCVAGGLAFLVDAGIVQTLVGLFGVDPLLARLPSFAGAVTCTWLFNRRYTFVPPAGLSLWQEASRYLLTQVAGLTVNFAVYAGLVLAFLEVRQWPVLGVAAGSCAGLLVNFVAARRWIYARPSALPALNPRQRDSTSNDPPR